MLKAPTHIFNLVAAALASFTTASVMAQGVPDAATLSRMFSPAELPAAATPHRQTVVFQPAAIDTAFLATLNPGEWFAVNAAPTRTFAARVDSIQRRGEGLFTITGTLDGLEETTFVIAVVHEAVAGSFQSPTTREHYKLKYTGEAGIHLVCQIDPSKYGRCGGALPPPPKPADAPWLDPVPDDVVLPADPMGGGGGGNDPFGDRGTCTAPQTVFDGIVAYTDNVRVAMGGTNAVLAEIELTQTVTNQVYTRSGVAARYRVVWTGEVNYAETRDGDIDLPRLADGGDGFLDSVYATKDAENADFCTLWLDSIGPNLCGLAYCNPNDATDAFNLVVWDCAADNFSHPHEIGHNQGCDHNDGDGGLGCGEYSYSLGHRFFASNQGYRTVMAYDTDPSGTYTRIGYFSTPNRTYLGVPVGTADHDNTRSINNTRARCEAFEPNRIDVWVQFGFIGPQNGSFNNPYASLASGVSVSRAASSSLAEDPSLFVKSGTTTYTGTISKSMWIRACGGAVNIGGNP